MISSKKIPNLFLIGAPKSGTTSVVASLKELPEVFVPKEKEPRFFDAHTFFDYEEDYPFKSYEDYLSIFNKKESDNKKYLVDGSVFNMYSLDSIHDILSMSPDAKFIIIIREPLSAVKSMYSQRMKYIIPQLREISEDFDDCWALSKERKNGYNFPSGCRNKFIFRYDLLYAYEKYLPDIMKTISSSNLHIASYRKLKEDPDGFYSEILDFLDLKKPTFILNKNENSSYIQQVNFVTRLVGFFAFKTYKVRKKMGLSGGRLKIFRNFLYRKNTKPVDLSNKSDDDIQNHFKETFLYLDSIKFKY